ncbi:MAG: glutaredoxin family protein [Pyrinomonadaceae bacterium]
MAIKVYGAGWCGDTKRTLRQLDALGLKYEYIDVEEDAQASEWVKAQNHGKELKPTLDMNGAVLSVPSNDELKQALQTQGLLS